MKEIAALDRHGVVHTEHLVKNGQEVLLPEGLGTVMRDRSPNSRIDGVVELEVLGQKVNHLHKIRPGKVYGDQLGLHRTTWHNRPGLSWA